MLSSQLLLGLPNGLFPVGLPVKILKALLPSSILATCPAHLNLLDLITLTIFGERYKEKHHTFYILHLNITAMCMHNISWGAECVFHNKKRCFHGFQSNDTAGINKRILPKGIKYFNSQKCRL